MHTLTLVIHRGERSVSYTNHFTARESTISTHWMGPRATLDTVEVRTLLPLATIVSSLLSCPVLSLLTTQLSWLPLWHFTYFKSADVLWYLSTGRCVVISVNRQILQNNWLPLPLFQDPKAELRDSHTVDGMPPVKPAPQHSIWKANKY
jgi:hypothetical protein